MTDQYLFLSMLVMAGVTFSLRATPFIVLKDRNKPFIHYLSTAMPAGVMAILVFYCLFSIDFSQSVDGLATALSTIVVVTLHHFFKNALLSIMAGTALNLFILNTSF